MKRELRGETASSETGFGSVVKDVKGSIAGFAHSMTEAAKKLVDFQKEKSQSEGSDGDI